MKLGQPVVAKNTKCGLWWKGFMERIPDNRPPDRMPPSWLFTLRKLTRQTNESNFHD